jgi:hypothetical protein
VKEVKGKRGARRQRGGVRRKGRKKDELGKSPAKDDPGDVELLLEGDAEETEADDDYGRGENGGGSRGGRGRKSQFPSWRRRDERRRTERLCQPARPQPHLSDKHSLVPCDQAVCDRVVDVATRQFTDYDRNYRGSVNGRRDIAGIAVSNGSGFAD